MGKEAVKTSLVCEKCAPHNWGKHFLFVLYNENSYGVIRLQGFFYILCTVCACVCVSYSYVYVPGFYYLFMCMYSCEFLYATQCRCSRDSENSIRCPGTGAAGSCEPRVGSGN